ncbi:MAG: autotransporter-associated beta strand repeat-containing protein, partial [Tepidisphaeraceae bacterium]
ANTGSVYIFNNLTVGANNNLNVTGANGYGLRFAGTTTVNGATTFNATTAPLYLGGQVIAGSQPITVTGTGGVRLTNTAANAGANSLTGSITLNGGVLQGFAPAAGSTGSNSLGTAPITLSGTGSILRLTPSFSSAPAGSAAGLAEKTFTVGTTLTSLAATNFLSTPTGTAVLSQLNIPSGAGPTTTSHQDSGLLNITTAGVYHFSASVDDTANLFIDGNAPIVVTAYNVTANGSFYLTAGYHTFDLRWNNNGGNQAAIISYQGPDTGNALNVIPASAFTYAPNASLATSFGNNVILNATANATVDVAANTSLGSLTISGTGAGTTLNVTGSGDVNTLTFTGTTLTTDLTVNTASAHLALAGGIAVSGGPGFVINKNGLGNLTLSGANAASGNINVNAGGLVAAGPGALNSASTLVMAANTTLQVLHDGSGSNGTINIGNNVQLTASGVTISVGNNGGASTGNTVALGALTTPATALATTTTFTGANGYNVSFSSLALPGTSGQDTVLVPTSTSVIIAGNVTNQEISGFTTGNYDTLYLDGTTTGNIIQGKVYDSPVGEYAGNLLGAYTRLIKRNTSTWTIASNYTAGDAAYTGITQVLAGTLKSGSNSVIPLNNLQGINVYATGAGITATYDFAGFNQTLNSTALTLGGSTTTSTPVVTGTGSTVTLNGSVTYSATNNPLGGLISVSNLDLGGGSRTFNVGDSTSAAIDLTVSSNISNGVLTKTGAGVLSVTGTLTNAIIAINGGTFDLAGMSRPSSNFAFNSGTIVDGTLTGTSFVKQGPGTFSVGNSTLITSSVTAVTVNQGLPPIASNPATLSTLNLDFTASGAPTANIFAATDTLTLGGSGSNLLAGGALALTGKASTGNSQSFASTLVDAGASAAALTIGTSGTVALNLGALTRNAGGTVDFTLPAGTQSSTNGVIRNPAGTAGTLLTAANGTVFGTVSGDNWAANSAVATQVGNIVGANVASSAGGTLYTTANSAATFSGNADITGSFTATSGATVNSIRFNTGSLTLTLAGTNTISTGGVLFGSGITAATITGGTIRPAAGQELVFINNKPNVAATIGSVLADGTSGPTTVTFRGNPNAGTTGAIFSVTANNTYTGPTYITLGRVQDSTAGVTTPLGTGTVYVDGNADGQFYLAANVTVANPFVVVGYGFNEAGGHRGAIRLDSSTANTPTLSGSITMLGDTSIGNNSAITAAGAGVLSGNILTSNALGASSFVLTKVYTGVLQLRGTTFQQTATTIQDLGALNITSDAALGASTGPLTFAGTGGTLQLANVMTFPSTRSIVINSGATGSIDTSALGTSGVTFPGVISGPGNFRKGYATASTTSAPLTLTGNNTFTGNVTIDGGWLIINNVSALGLGPKTIAINNGTAGLPQLHLDPGAGGTIDIPANMSFNTSSNTGAVTNDSGNNIIRGNFTLNSGGGGTTILSNAGSLTLAGNITPSQTLRDFRVRGDGNGLISGVIANGSTVDLPVYRDGGAGTWTFSGANTYTGSTNVSAGTLRVGNISALGGVGLTLPTTDNGTNVSGTGTLDLAGFTNINEAIKLSGAGNGGIGALVNSGAPVSIGGSLAGITGATGGLCGPNLTITGGGGTGATATASLGVTSSTFALSSGGSGYSVVATATITGGGATTQGTATALMGVTAATFALNASSGYTVAPTITFNVPTGGTAATGHFVIAGDGSLSLVIDNPGSGYTAAPTATLVTLGTTTGTPVSVTPTFTNLLVTGVTVATAGVGYTSAPTIAFTGASTTQATATANANNFSLLGVTITNPGTGYTSAPTVAFSSGANPVPLTGNLAGIVLTGDSSIGGTGNIAVNSPITESGGPHALTKVGANTLTLTAVNTWTGATNINAGTVRLSGAGQLPSMTAVTLSTGATLDLNGNSQTIGSLAGTGGNLALGGLPATTLTVGNASNTSFGGTITGSGSLVKTGSGALQLTGANTYTGPTTVNAGTLALSSTGSLANPTVNVNPTGTLAAVGNVTMGGAGPGTNARITVAGGGGTLNLVDGTFNTLTLDASVPSNVLTVGSATQPSNLVFEIGTAGNDQIVVAGTNTATFNAGGALVTINALNGVYDGSTKVVFVSPATDLTAGGPITLNAAAGNWGGYQLSLATNPHDVRITGVANATPATAYFKGSIDANWNTFTGGSANNSNWTTDSGGTTDPHALPAATTDVHFYATGGTNLATTLGRDFTIQSLTMDPTATSAVTIAGGGTLTIGSAAGITSSAGAGALTINAPLGVGADQTLTNNSLNPITISGGLIGAHNLTLNTTTAAGIVLSTASLNNNGTIANAGTGTGAVAISAPLGGSLASIIQNSTTSSTTITGDASAYTGSLTLTAGTLALNYDGTGSGQRLPFGSGIGANVVVNGSATLLVDRVGTVNSGNLITLGGLTIGAGNNLTVTGATYLNGTTGNATLTTGNYAVAFTGPTNITGNATFTLGTSPTAAAPTVLLAAPVTLSGVVNGAGQTITVQGPVPNATQVSLALTNTSSATPNNLTGSTFNVLAGGILDAKVAVGGTDNGTSSLGTAAVTLGGGALRLGPILGTTVTGTPGFSARYYNSIPTNTDVSLINGLTTPTASNTTPVINMPNLTTGWWGGGSSPTTMTYVAGVPTANMSAIWTGVLNITTPGYYGFRSQSDDGSQIYLDGSLAVNNNFNHGVDGQLPYATTYLTAGYHTMVERYYNGTGSAAAVTSYQGPDTGNTQVLVGSIPGSVIIPAAELPVAAFSNAVSLTGGTTSTIDTGTDTSIAGLATTVGTGDATLNVTGSGLGFGAAGNGLNTLTVVGTTTLAGNLIVNPTSANLAMNGGFAASAFTLTKNGVANLTLSGANLNTGNVTVNAGGLITVGPHALNSASTATMAAGTSIQILNPNSPDTVNSAGTLVIPAITLQILDNGSGNNGTINVGSNVQLTATGTTINVGPNGGTSTGNTVAFGALNTPATAVATTTTFTGSSNYNMSFTSLALPGTSGNDTVLVPTTTSVTIRGNVTNQETTG